MTPVYIQLTILIQSPVKVEHYRRIQHDRRLPSILEPACLVSTQMHILTLELCDSIQRFAPELRFLTSLHLQWLLRISTGVQWLQCLKGKMALESSLISMRSVWSCKLDSWHIEVLAMHPGWSKEEQVYSQIYGVTTLYLLRLRISSSYSCSLHVVEELRASSRQSGFSLQSVLVRYSSVMFLTGPQDSFGNSSECYVNLLPITKD